MTGDTIIYALVDPREPDVVRYVGQTTRPAERLREHAERKNLGRADKEEWLDALAAAGVTPQMVELDRLPADAPRFQRDHYEAVWTFYFARERRHPLVGGGNTAPLVLTLAGQHAAEWEGRL